MRTKLSTKRDLELLKARREPYWQPIDGVPGRSVGVRKTENGIYWLARQAGANGKKYVQLALRSQNFSDAIKEATTALFDQLDSGLTFSDITVEEIFDRYCKTVKENPTNVSLKKCLGKLGKVKLRDLRKADIVAWVESDDLLNGRKGQPRSLGSVQRMISPIRAALNMAVHKDLLKDGNWKQGFITKYTSLNTKHIEETELNERRYLTPSERRSIIDAANDDAKQWLELCATTPMRPGDWSDRTVKHFDERSGTLFVESKNHPRHMKLNSKNVEMLKSLCADKGRDALIFTRNATGGGWDRETWNDAFKSAAKVALIDESAVLYNFRHSVITELLENGLSATQVGKLAGTSTTMIEKTYAKSLLDVQEAALEKIVV